MLDNKKKDWVQLKKTPIVMVIFQMVFRKDDFKISDYLRYENEIKKTLPKGGPIRNFNVNLQTEAGLSAIKSDIGGYWYFSENQKNKLELSNGQITYTLEHEYKGWDSFKEDILHYLNIVSPALDNGMVNRLSIRFINRFGFDGTLNPTDYFKTTVSSTEATVFPYPITNYMFRIVANGPETGIYSIVNQSIDESLGKHNYIFDIDVLYNINLIFDVDSILANLGKLRDVKNEIFFNNITEKTIDLCS
jgi:uncharacterized protein (TIGR04255 family)